jgi:hypothetical protein
MNFLLGFISIGVLGFKLGKRSPTLLVAHIGSQLKHTVTWFGVIDMVVLTIN